MATFNTIKAIEDELATRKRRIERLARLLRQECDHVGDMRVAARMSEFSSAQIRALQIEAKGLHYKTASLSRRMQGILKALSREARRVDK